MVKIGNNSKIKNSKIGNNSEISNKEIIINNESIKIPKHLKGKNISIINGKLFIDGYEYRKGEFKKTLKALFYKYV